MTKIFPPVLFAMVATLANANAAASMVSAMPVTKITRFGSVTTEFACGSRNPGHCNYLILKSLCEEKYLDNGEKERTCRYTEAVPAFQVKAGESRKIANLPADFLYTMKVGAMPTVDECLSASMVH